MSSRREFLKTASLFSILVACGKLPPPGTSIPTTERPKPVTPVSTDKPKATDTPDIPATKEAERLNTVLAEGYPASFSELTQEKMLSEIDFLKQLEKFPNIGKEYKQVKAMLSAGLAKTGVKLEEIDFETSSFSWDADKYSWIVIARNKKTGEVYVPRDEKTHTRNIDMSVYGYLKEYQAGGALPFTMEKLKLPEFSGPEYKVGFARSKKGWLAATLTNTESKSTIGWYDFRDKEVARWNNETDIVLTMVDGVSVEDIGDAGTGYNEIERVELNRVVDEIRLALKNKRLLYPSGSLKTNLDGRCEVLKEEDGDITVGFRKCFKKDGSSERIVIAWDRSDGAFVVPSGGGGYFVKARAYETGSILKFDDVDGLPVEIRQSLYLNKSARTWHVEYPWENKASWSYRKQSHVVGLDSYRHLQVVKFLPERAGSVERIVWAESTDSVDVSNEAIDKWIDRLFLKLNDGTYSNIRLFDSKYKVDEVNLRKSLEYLKVVRDKLPWIMRLVLKTNIVLMINRSGGLGQMASGSSLVKIDTSYFDRFSNDSMWQLVMAAALAHEQVHASQRWNGSEFGKFDPEVQTLYVALLVGHALGAEKHPYFVDRARLLQTASYPLGLVT